MLVFRIVIHHEDLVDTHTRLGCILNPAALRIDDLAFYGMGFLTAKDDVRSTVITIHLLGRKVAVGAIFIKDCFCIFCMVFVGILNHDISIYGILLIYIPQLNLIINFGCFYSFCRGGLSVGYGNSSINEKRASNIIKGSNIILALDHQGADFLGVQVSDVAGTAFQYKSGTVQVYMI